MYSKKLLVLISAIAAIAAVFSFIAFSEDEIGATENVGMNYEVADSKELQEIINSSIPGTNITLTADIKLNGQGYINVDGKTVSIDLNGHVIDAQREVWAEDGYAIKVGSGSLLTIKDSAGTGAIVGGNAKYGGGIHIIKGGIAYLSSGSVKYNKASIGGGGIYNAGTLVILGGEIHSNEAGTWGGGIYSTGTLNIEDGTIYANNSGKDGGGIYSGGNTVINDGNILTNVAQKSAGGLRISGGEVTINGGTFEGNIAHDDHGGAIYAADNCKFHLWGGTIAANIAAQTGGGILITPSCSFYVKSEPYVNSNTASITANNIMIRTGAVINLEGEMGHGATLNIEMQDYSSPITSGFSAHGSPSSAFIHGLDNSDIETFHKELWFKNNDVVHVSSWDALQNAVDNASYRQTIVIDSNINWDDETRIKVRNGHHVIIDLNGHSLNRNNPYDFWSGTYGTNGHVIEVLDNGTELTLKDSAGGGKLHAGGAKHGGGVCVGKGATFILDGGTIDWCDARYGGGVYVKGTFIMNGGSIYKCKAEENGGAICITDSGKAYLYGGRITECKAEDDAGAIYLDSDGVLEMDGVYVGKNTAEDTGGALYLKNSATIRNCTFEENEAKSTDAGAIKFKGKDLYLYNTTFSSNKSRSDGGAINCDGDNLYVDGCLFKVNKARINAKAGAIFLCEGAWASIKNSQFNVNISSEDGGALYVNNGAKAEVEGCTFYANEAQYAGGGAIYVDDEHGDEGILIVSKTVFRENSCSESAYGVDGCGGAICSEGTVTIKNGCQFIDNKASQSGGALYIEYGECTIYSDSGEDAVEFIGNYTLERDGGAIYINDGTLSLNNTHMTSNDAVRKGGAIIALEDAEVNISGRNVIQGNMASLGTDVYLMDGIKLNLTSTISGSYIFVSVEDKLGKFTTNYSTYHTSRPGVFFFSSDDLEVIQTDGEAALENRGPVTTRGEFIPWNAQINDGSVSGCNWMSALSGERYLYEVNIPGTVDSASKNCSDSHNYKAQNRYIDEQLYDGVRLLDIKVSSYYYTKGTFSSCGEEDNGGLWVVLTEGYMGYGQVRCYNSDGDLLSFHEVLDMVKDFLTKHPTETVIINIEAINKEDDKTGTTNRLASVLDALSKEINPNTGATFLYYEGKDPCAPLTHYPQIKDCRGKIVFITNEKDVDTVGGLCLERMGVERFPQTPISEYDSELAIVGALHDVVNVAKFYDLDYRVYLPSDASHSNNPILFWADSHAKSGFFFSLRDMAKVVNRLLFWDREVNDVFFPRGDYFGFFSIDDATADKVYEIWYTNFFTEQDLGPAELRDGLQYRTITVRSGLDQGLYPMQTYKLLKGTIIDIPFSIYDYDQVANDNYLEGWLITDTTGTELYKPGQQYRLMDDNVAIVAKWTNGTLQTPIRVVWADGNDYDGLRPETLLLKINGEDHIVRALGEWRTAYTGPVTSIVAEWEKIDTDAEGKYSCTITGDQGVGYTIRLCHTPNATVSIIGKAYWSNDSINDLHDHPDSVTICLFADGKLRTTSTAWNLTYYLWGFVMLPKFENGQEIKYEVVQMPVPGYVTYSQGWNVLNVKQDRSEYADYVIIWNDTNHENRPDNLTLTFKPTESSQGVQQTIAVSSEYNYWQTGGIKFGSGQVDNTSSLTVQCPSGYTAEITKLSNSNQLFTVVLSAEVNPVQEVEAKIDAIGTVTDITEGTKLKIDDARTAYAALPENNKPFVSNFGKLIAAELAFAILSATEQDAENVKDLIDGLRTNSKGEKISPHDAVTNTPQFLHKMTEARNAYDRLSEANKAYVTNYDDLLYMENRYNELLNGKTTVNVTIIWNDNNSGNRPSKVDLDFKPRWNSDVISVEVSSLVAPSFDQKVYIRVTTDVDNTASLTVGELNGYDSKVRYDEGSKTYFVILTTEWEGSPVKAVEDLISAIGNVIYSVECKNKIDNARSEYTSLTDVQKLAVRNYEVLPAAEAEYAVKAGGDEAAASVSERIESIGTVKLSIECKEKIRTARTLYDMLTDLQREQVLNYHILEAAENAYAELVSDNVRAIVVEAMIDSIEGATSAEQHQEFIVLADAAYEALTDSQKSLVTNYEVLERAKEGPQVPVMLFRMDMNGWTYREYDPSTSSLKLLDYYGKPYVHPESIQPDIQYTDSEGEVVEPSCSLPAGTYKVTVSFGAGTTYPAAKKTVEFKVETASIDPNSVKVELDKYEYDGTEAKVTATLGKLIPGEDFTISVQQNGQAATLKDPGDYEVVLTMISPSCLYSDGETTHTVAVQMDKAQNAIQSLTLEGWQEGDQPNAPVVISPFGSDTAVFTYSDSVDGEFTDEVPTAIGTWYVRATIAPTDLYYGSTETVSFAIEVKTYTVTFDSKGGSTPSFTSKVLEAGSVYGDLPTTSRGGYSFVGWYTASGVRVTASTIFAGSEDITLYAQWSPTSNPGPYTPKPAPSPPTVETEEKTVTNPDGSVTDTRTQTSTYKDGTVSERVSEKTVEDDGTETIKESTKVTRPSSDGSVSISESATIESGDEKTVYSKDTEVTSDGVESSRSAIESTITSDVTITTTAVSEKTPQSTTSTVQTVLDATGVGTIQESHILAALDNAKKVAEMLDPEGAAVRTIEIHTGSETVMAIDSDGLKTLARNDAPLTIVSEAGTLSYDADVVSALSGRTGTIILSMKNNDESALNESQKDVIGDATFISVTATAGSETISELGGTASMSFEFNNPQAWKKFAAYYIDESGKKEPMEWTYDGKTMTVKSNHHSIYAVLEVTDEPIDIIVWIGAGIVVILAIAILAYFVTRSRSV